MRLHVQAAPAAHYAWLTQRLGVQPSASFRAIEAVDSTGRILGMCGYDGWTPHAVLAHMAVDSPIAWRALLGPAFSYPFQQAGRGLILGTIRASNARSLALARRFGFRETHRVQDGWAPGEALVLVELRKEDCRFLKETPCP